MRPIPFPMPDVKDAFQPFVGAMDQVNPTLQLRPGVARRSMNFECSLNGGGFSRIGGYERFDGQRAPSSVGYTMVPITYLSFLTAGQTLEGMTSGTTALVLFVGSNYAIVCLMSAPGFLQGEIVAVSGNAVGTVSPQTITLTRSEKQQYRALAANAVRSAIQQVPGQGPVRGVFGASFQGVFSLYAVRDFDGGSVGIRAKLYRASASGWLLIPFNLELRFYAGSGVAPSEGSLLYSPGLPQAFMLKRVLLQSGDWTTNDATGTFILVDTLNGGDSTSGAFNELFGTFTVGGTTFRTFDYAAKVTWQAGGRFEFVVDNFGGRLAERRVYGCDGVNRCFEFDGETLVPISTGIEVPSLIGYEYVVFDDRPSHLVVHQHHLMVAIGSSLINSAITTPYNWQAINGALETACGDTVTNLQIMPGSQQNGALAVFLRNHTKILYGTASVGASPFNLVSFESDTGALPWTVQKLDKLYYLDDRGVISLNATLAYGNFTSATLTRSIQPFIDWKRGRATCSLLNRAKSQYRLFFNDGMGLFLTFDNGKLKGALPVAMPVPFACAWSGEDDSGNELSFVGGTDGYVYQLERGTSFDGLPIDFELLPNWNTMKSHRRLKHLDKAAIELMEGDYAEFSFGARMGPEESNHLQDPLVFSVMQEELTMQWDHFTWDNFFWDGHELSPMELDVKGMSERVQYAVSGSSDCLDPFTFTGITTRYFMRRGIR